MSSEDRGLKQVSRRDILKYTTQCSAAMSLTTIVGCSESGNDREVLPIMTKDWQDAFSPEEVLQLAKDGNHRFVTDTNTPRDYLADQRALTKSQHPLAVILSCIDSRAPAEIILDAGIGDVFNTRIAGNFVNPDIAGSMEYACAVAGAKLVLVMGHTDCGAIKGAIDGVELGNLTGLLDSIEPAVAAVDDITGERNSKNPSFVEAVASMNIRLTIQAIRSISPILRNLEAEGEILIVGALYQVESGEIEFFD